MAYDDKELKRHVRQQRRKKDRGPVTELSENEARKRLENDILGLLLRVNDREYFVREVEKLTARYGLRLGAEQRENALRVYDQYQKQRRNVSR